MEFNFEGESSCGGCGVPRGGFGSFAIIVSSVSFFWKEIVLVGIGGVLSANKK